MSNEKLDWKPETGGKAWMISASGNVLEVMVGSINGERALVSSHLHRIDRGARVSCRISSLYPTSEMAIANTVVRVYDLEGKEVVIPRADGWPLKPEDCPQWDGDMGGIQFVPREVSQVKLRDEDFLYECPSCNNVDSVTNFCANCGVKFTEAPIHLLVFTEKGGKIATTEYSMDLSHKPEKE